MTAVRRRTQTRRDRVGVREGERDRQRQTGSRWVLICLSEASVRRPAQACASGPRQRLVPREPYRAAAASVVLSVDRPSERRRRRRWRSDGWLKVYVRVQRVADKSRLVRGSCLRPAANSVYSFPAVRPLPAVKHHDLSSGVRYYKSVCVEQQNKDFKPCLTNSFL